MPRPDEFSRIDLELMVQALAGGLYPQEGETLLRLTDQWTFRFSGNTIASFTLPAGVSNNFDIGSASVIRITSNAAGSTLSGILAGTSGRELLIINLVSTLTLLHQSVLSLAGNRFNNISGASVVLTANQVARYMYDDTSVFWRQV